MWNHVLDPGSGQNGTGMGPDSWTPWYMTGRENGAVAKRVRRLVEKRGSVLHEWGRVSGKGGCTLASRGEKILKRLPRSLARGRAENMESCFWAKDHGRGLGLEVEVEVRCGGMRLGTEMGRRAIRGLWLHCRLGVDRAPIHRKENLRPHTVMTSGAPRLSFPSSTQLIALSLAPPKRPASHPTAHPSPTPRLSSSTQAQSCRLNRNL